MNGQGGSHAGSSSGGKHGGEGEGGHDENGPPLWGDQSFTAGAGMAELRNLASFAYHNMPRHNPILSEEEALDIAVFVVDQPRPKFEKDEKPW